MQAANAKFTGEITDERKRGGNRVRVQRLFDFFFLFLFSTKLFG
jgi:hypothetical protein